MAEQIMQILFFKWSTRSHQHTVLENVLDCIRPAQVSYGPVP